MIQLESADLWPLFERGGLTCQKRIPSVLFPLMDMLTAICLFVCLFVCLFEILLGLLFVLVCVALCCLFNCFVLFWLVWHLLFGQVRVGAAGHQKPRRWHPTLHPQSANSDEYHASPSLHSVVWKTRLIKS